MPISSIVEEEFQPSARKCFIPLLGPLWMDRILVLSRTLENNFGLIAGYLP